MGFAGVAIKVGRDIQKTSGEVSHTHNDLPVVVFMGYPNVHREVVQMQEGGGLPRDFAEETLFTNDEVDKATLTPDQKTDSYFDPIFIEGFFDKEKGEWVSN